MRKALLLCLSALLSVSLAVPALTDELNDVRSCPVAGEFMVVCPAGWQTSDSTYASSSSGDYVWLYLLWNHDTCISISKENLGRKYEGFNLAGASRREMDDACKAYLKDRPDKGSYRTAYLETVYSAKDWIPFFISRCVGSEYAANPKDDHLYYYYEAITIINGWRVSLSVYSNAEQPRLDASDSDLQILKDAVLSFTLT